ncbi:DMT family transporter [Hazenella coriacea]|uniref:RarD protein n=1 Tax=Hazenella coriacea TaxID=1179467 RepID=A0A4R3L2R3_9BACL|nr:EamA family transporter [Hazenella coriacea]TCS93148.1 RarD protein [Hazenella coriacea]
MRIHYLWVIVALLIWGSVGLFVRWVNLPSEVIVFYRVIISFLVLGMFLLSKGVKWEKVSWKWLLVSGLALSLNWVLFFKAIQTTTIANAVLSYNLAPVFVTLLSPWVLRERIEKKTWLAMGIAMVGVISLVGVSKEPMDSIDLQGISLGLTAAFFYAWVTLSGKKMEHHSSMQLVFWQTGLATLILTPYGLQQGWVGLPSLGILFILGTIHTALALVLYYKGLKKIKVQHIGVLAYLDPVSAVLFSMFLLGEIPSIGALLGGGLILASNYLILRKEITSS